MNKQTILLAGAGPMAIEYAKVLKKLRKEFVVVGRGKQSATQFEKTTGIKPSIGGLEDYLSKNNFPIQEAIIAVSEDQLGTVAIKLIQYGVKSILIEKPGGSSFEDIKTVATKAGVSKTKIFVAYNRRFYSSVAEAREIIKKDGGVLSLHFEFTEIADRITPLKKAPGVKENWLMHNSSHVIDLAFFLGGQPKIFSAYIKGRLPWHPKASVFAGAGITENNAIFSYQANWEAPGRWGIEILTKNKRLILKPLEKLQVQKKGSFEISEVSLDNQVDIDFKPGLYKQVKAFLDSKQNYTAKITLLCTIAEQAGNLNFYKKILEGYHA
ncbi:MAG: hypothetical protein ACD_32C00113G0015 [uncultured bacterium]|uniref:Gfo/Idh/MocA-like oxidoreductase N-terminal domain-containing protein n=1 Tax=Candidatus Daviesbacteria bacterium GW2011_GWC2_40_12 TaxID=1618431 RepID=A0A0G0QR97_9BACT|nr:MAG: hypothetical protein ACD_32C00113G0015 [uncultured bacterium]KKR17254.1 MAG: hypothetical protein UT45_C0002G0083 [Candidatus Daviesbacteria bacterium GW2011_GWA2_39_33]KKR42653.1 MAG: hypothetical protein UT77_C0001G0104 [Candidatus Daviesbacteria bacterium GW2011_GWC2_40_12]OGE21328.1 MAG: myo-inositol 2-dehydrogenase [Candidatus Daviesbacteria bacterium RIFCSPHIGHO2_01_FULL_40_24]OGE30154.1 MAG: myo-inositol 2-dehydrogenase [Candidatus Daviesbacteria bacterium RIFCSPHIGHO2_02_FULL_40